MRHPNVPACAQSLPSVGNGTIDRFTSSTRIALNADAPTGPVRSPKATSAVIASARPRSSSTRRADQNVMAKPTVPPPRSGEAAKLVWIVERAGGAFIR